MDNSAKILTTKERPVLIRLLAKTETGPKNKCRDAKVAEQR
jgi:hypothetical protein